MVLKAWEACRVSIVPVSGIGGAFKSLPSRSAAAESEARGAVTRRTAHTDTARMMNAMSAHGQQELVRERRPARGQGGRERQPLAIRQGHRDLQIAKASKHSERTEAVHHRAAPHHWMPGVEHGTVRGGSGYARLPRRPKRQLIDEKILDRLGNRCVVVGSPDCRRFGGEQDAERRVAQCSNDPLPPFVGGFLDKACQIGDALSGSKAADGAHGLLAVCSINPRAKCMRNDQPGEQDEQGLTKEALGKKPAHSWTTVGVNM